MAGVKEEPALEARDALGTGEEGGARVVHVRDDVPGAVYVGRAMPRQRLAGSPFGNPFKVKQHGRAEAIRRYRESIAAALRRSPELVEQLIALRGKPLACWCRHDGEPRTEANACHADVLVEFLAAHTDDELRRMAA